MAWQRAAAMPGIEPMLDWQCWGFGAHPCIPFVDLHTWPDWQQMLRLEHSGQPTRRHFTSCSCLNMRSLQQWEALNAPQLRSAICTARAISPIFSLLLPLLQPACTTRGKATASTDEHLGQVTTCFPRMVHFMTVGIVAAGLLLVTMATMATNLRLLLSPRFVAERHSHSCIACPRYT